MSLFRRKSKATKSKGEKDFAEAKNQSFMRSPKSSIFQTSFGGARKKKKSTSNLNMLSQDDRKLLSSDKKKKKKKAKKSKNVRGRTTYVKITSGRGVVKSELE